jgi:hypothetical protein
VAASLTSNGAYACPASASTATPLQHGRDAGLGCIQTHMTHALSCTLGFGVFAWITIRAVTLDPALRDGLNRRSEW